MALDPAGRLDSAASAAHLYAVKERLADALRLNVYTWPARDELRFIGLQLARSLELLGFQTAAEQRYAEEFCLYPDNVFSTIASSRRRLSQPALSASAISQSSCGSAAADTAIASNRAAKGSESIRI